MARVGMGAACAAANAPTVFGASATSAARNARPPAWVWMPNQPHPTSARASAGTCAPLTPKAARARTGNGAPYFVPACPLANMGSRTMRFARVMHAMPCATEKPTSTTDPASVYAGTHTTRPIQRDAMSTASNVRSRASTGARSALMSVGEGFEGARASMGSDTPRGSAGDVADEEDALGTTADEPRRRTRAGDAKTPRECAARCEPARGGAAEGGGRDAARMAARRPARTASGRTKFGTNRVLHPLIAHRVVRRGR